jgi:hypothetical protein
MHWQVSSVLGSASLDNLSSTMLPYRKRHKRFKSSKQKKEITRWLEL